MPSVQSCQSAVQLQENIPSPKVAQHTPVNGYCMVSLDECIQEPSIALSVNQPLTTKQRIAMKMIQNGGKTFRIVLSCLWSIVMVLYAMMGVFGVVILIHGDMYSLIGLLLLIPALFEIVCILLIIYGMRAYSYGIAIFACVWSALNALVLFMFAITAPQWFIGLIYYGCIFAFSVRFAQKIAHSKADICIEDNDNDSSV
eukprot:32567_1